MSKEQTYKQKNEDALAGILQDLHKANSNLDEMNKETHDQNNMIQRSKENVQKAQQSVNNTQFQANGMKSFFGKIMNLFRKPEKAEPATDMDNFSVQSTQNTDEKKSSMRIEENSSHKNEHTGSKQDQMLDEILEQTRIAKHKEQLFREGIESSSKNLDDLHKQVDKMQNSQQKLSKTMQKML